MIEHHIVYIPGLNDQHWLNKSFLKLLPLFWDPKQFPIHIFYPHWEEGNSFQEKLLLITETVDDLTSRYERVSIIGQSAGGSAALNTFVVRINDLAAAVNVTGRLAEGKDVAPTLNEAAKKSPSFRKSVNEFEKLYEPTLFPEDRKRILTIRPRWDEVVPTSTVAVNGAKNLVVPAGEHMIGGMLIMSKYAFIIQNFLRRLDSLYLTQKNKR